MKYHLMLVRIAIIKNQKNYKCWWKCGEKKTLCSVGGMQIGADPMDNMEGPQTIKKQNYHITQQLHFWEENKHTNLKAYLQSMFTAALFIITKIWKQHKYPSRVNEENVLYTHTHTHTHCGTSLSHEKRVKSCHWDNTNGPWGITLSEIA